MNESTTTSTDISSEIYTDILEELFANGTSIAAFLKQIIEARGKAVRPQFMSIVSALSGGSWESLKKAAMIIEAIHIASLLHDDVLDGSGLRRGAETINVRYSDKLSILSGDYFFARAIHLAYSYSEPAVMEVILTSVERMIRGEIRDSLMNGVIDEETYVSIVADKTASLFAASGEIAVILSGACDGERQWGRDIGEYVGTAFQIVDDALDYQGDINVMGKPELMDVKAGRMTLPLIYSLRDYDTDEKKSLLGNGDSKAHELTEIVINNGGIEYALERAHSYLDRARQIALKFKNNEAQAALNNFFETLIDRQC